MCRMIAVMSKKSTGYRYIIEKHQNGGAFHSLMEQSGKSYDGWRDGGHKDGFGIYAASFEEGGEGQNLKGELLFKKGTPISETPELSRRLENISGNLLIAHIRLASAGKGEIQDIHAHPYAETGFIKAKNIADITDWKNYIPPYSGFILAHNGTVYDIGDETMTDSQALLNIISQEFSGGIDFDDFKTFLSGFAVSHSFTAVNMMLKDPDNDLYIVRLAKAGKPGETPESRQPRLAYYSMYYMKDEAKDCVIAASEPIDNDIRWKCVDNYSLIKIDKNLNIKKAEIPFL